MFHIPQNFPRKNSQHNHIIEGNFEIIKVKSSHAGFQPKPFVEHRRIFWYTFWWSNFLDRDFLTTYGPFEKKVVLRGSKSCRIF